MKIYEDIIQGTDEWKRLKLGKFSASKADDLYSAASTAKYQNVINEVVAGKVFEVIQDSYQSSDMIWGTENEPFARKKYQLMTFYKVAEVGFVELNDFVGMSPDGLIGDDGLIEIKCPKLTTHISYLISGKVPQNYYRQMQFQMMVSGRKWCDFFSYYPDDNIKPFLQRVERNESDIKELNEKLTKAIELAKQRINLLKNN